MTNHIKFLYLVLGPGVFPSAFCTQSSSSFVFSFLCILLLHSKFILFFCWFLPILLACLYRLLLDLFSFFPPFYSARTLVPVTNNICDLSSNVWEPPTIHFATFHYLWTDASYGWINTVRFSSSQLFNGWGNFIQH